MKNERQLAVPERYHSTLYKEGFHFIYYHQHQHYHYYHQDHDVYSESTINFILIRYRQKLMGRPKGCQNKGTSKARKLEQRIKFANYQLDLGKDPENVETVHLCIDRKNIYGYCTCYLSMALDTWTSFVGNLQRGVAKV